MPETRHYASIHAVAAAVLLALACAATLACADAPVTPPAPTIRTDVIAVRLTPAAAAALGAPASPRAAGAARTLAVPEGSFGALASRLGLSLERAFPQASARRVATMSQSAGADEVEQRLARRWLAHLPQGLTPQRAIEQLRNQQGVESAEPVHLVPVEAAPNDSLWSSAYYFYQPSRRDMHAPEAWDITTGDSSQVIAIIDTGVLLTHPDLAGPGPGIGGNIWINRAESAGLPGVDDDGNGYIDDSLGWDFVALPDTGLAVKGEDWQDEDNDPNDFTGHGTGVAGIAGALTNNRIGVAGTAPHARLMVLRVGYSGVSQQSGVVDESAAARAIVYAVRNGATVLNCSFSSVPQSDMTDALDLAQAAGVVVVVAGGNNGSEHAMADRPEVISVGAVDKNDKLTLFSNTGPYVDLCAAGLFVSTTTLQREAEEDSAHRCHPDYSATASGTSFSSPIAAGAVALLQADRRARGLAPLRPAEVRLRLVETADSIAAQNPTASGYGSGRLNLLRMLTDPRGSSAVWLGGAAVGAPVVLPPVGGIAGVVTGTITSRLIRIHGGTRAIEWDVALPSPAAGSASAANMGGGSGVAIFIATTDGHVCGFDAAGNTLPGWPHEATHPTEGPASPALADLDGDGRLEVVWGDGQGAVHAWHADGSIVPGFPVAAGPVTSSVWVALADLDGDGAAEIIAASARGGVTAFDGAAAPLPGWPTAPVANLVLQHPPIVALLGDSPLPSIIATETTTLESAVRILNLDGSTRNWVRIDGLAAGSTAVADVDGDGHADIVVLCGTGEVKIINGVTFALIPAPARVAGTPGSITPELIVARNARGEASIVWSAGGQLNDCDGLRRTLGTDVRFGDATPALADLDGDGKLEMLAAGTADRSLFVYLTQAPAAGNDTLWATARGNASRTGNAIPPGTVLPDRVAPRATLDLRLEGLGGGSAELSWTAPFGGARQRAARYDLRRSATPITASNFASATVIAGVAAPGNAGSRERAHVGGVAAGSVVYVALTSADSAGNVSPLSNVVRIPTIVNAPTYVRATGADTASIELAWAAVGNSGRDGQAAAYEVRAARQALTAATFETATIRLQVPATLGAGQVETSRLVGLATGTRYWVAVRAIDSLGLLSPISNVLATATMAGVQPLPVAGLRIARRGTDAFQLEWTSTGTRGRNGEAAGYELRASRRPITALDFDDAEVQKHLAATRPAGQTVRDTLNGLTGDVEYWVAVRAVDSLGFASVLSNVVSGVALPPAIADLRVTYTDTLTVALAWTATMSALDVANGMVVDIAATPRPLDAAGFDAAEVHRVVGPSVLGSLGTATLDGLAAGSRYSIAVRMRDPDGNVSALSNIATGVTTPRILPRAVGAVRVVSLASTEADLAWSSTGRSGHGGEAAAYDLRATREPLDARGYELAALRVLVPATHAVGEDQVATFTGLAPNTRYWVAVRAIDSLGYVAALSDTLALTTRPPLAPVRVTDLRVLNAGTTSLELAWTSIGTSGHDGQATRYELRASERSIDAANFDAAEQLRWLPSTLPKGEVWRASYSNLETGKRYWFALRAIDTLGLKSPVSNIVSVVPGPLAGIANAGIAVGHLDQGARLFWKADAASTRFHVHIRILDINGRQCREFDLPAASEGIFDWDGNTSAGARAAPGIYFARLQTRYATAQSKLLLLP